MVVVGLIVGTTGCFTPFRVQYELTISSTEGGEVTTPGEGIFTYWEGTTVNLTAEAEECYHFVSWTGNVSIIGNVTSATTNITMNCDYSITANFGLFAGGNGTAEDPYQIADWYHLDNIRNYLNSHFIVINDLDANSIGYTELASETANEGKGWEPIGILGLEFDGTFDGQGYEISDLFINRPDEVVVGLFGCVGELAVVRNIGMVNADVTGGSGVGVLVGASTGEITDCYVTGSVSGELHVGGLAGAVCGPLLGCPGGPATLSMSYAIVNVIGIEDVGGLVGINDSPVTNCYSMGSVTGNSSVGGLVGVNVGIVTNSYATGSVTGNTSIGGLVGENTIQNDPVEGTVNNSFWDTETSGQSASAGGTGKTTAEMQDISTFTDATWDIVVVANPGTRNPAYIWNIVNSVTYPFLSWQL